MENVGYFCSMMLDNGWWKKIQERFFHYFKVKKEVKAKSVS